MSEQGEYSIFEVLGIEDYYEKTEEIEENTITSSEWIFTGGEYMPTSKAVITKFLKPGEYSVLFNNRKYSVEPQKVELDDVMKLPNNIIDVLHKEINEFWKKSKLFEEHGLVHKRGILLVGPAGTGKTSIVNLLSTDLIKHGGIVFRIRSINDLTAFVDFTHTHLRRIEPNRPIITIIEDIDNLFAKDQSSLLAFLCGEDQVNHNVTIATSNRVHELNDLILRPSRFDWIVEIDLPDKENRKFYFEKKGLVGEELDHWVNKSEDMSLAQMKEMFIAVKLLDNDLDSTLQKLKEQKNMITTSTFISTSKKNKGFGFGRNN